MKKVLLVCLLIAGTAGFLAAAGAQETEEETFRWVWNISGTGTATSPYGRTAQYIADEIADRSDGRLTIDLNYGGALGYGASEMLEVTSQGLVDGGDLSLPNLVGSESLGNFGSLPFLHVGFDEYWNWMDELLIPRLSDYFEEEWGVIPIGEISSGYMFLLWNERLEDTSQLQGERLRVFGDINIRIFEELGVNVITLPVEELHTALERDMIDGMPNSSPLIDQLEAWEYYDYRNDLGAVIGSSFFAVNKQSFEALPEDLQQLVKDVAWEATLHGRELVLEFEEEMTQRFTEKGMETFQVPEHVTDEIRSIGRNIWASWAEQDSKFAEELMQDTFEMLGM